TSGGLHGVGASVVNALSEELVVEVARARKLYRQVFRRGIPQGPLETVGDVHNRRGTMVRFRPDPTIFEAGAAFRPATLLTMSRSKAYLYSGVEFRWRCAPELVRDSNKIPSEAVFHLPGGLRDFLSDALDHERRVVDEIFAG